MLGKSGITIGIIEDNSFQLRVITSFVHSTYPAADVWSATRVSDAQKRMKEKPPRLLILDVHLNDGTCWELLDLYPIEKRPFKIISVTGDHNEETLNKLNEYKVDSIFRKPLNFPTLKSEIDSYLSGRSPDLFYGRSEGIGSVEVNFEMKLTHLSETFATLETKVGMSKGVIFKIAVFGQLVPMKVMDISRDTLSGTSTIKASVLSGLMSLEEQKILRSGIVQHTG